MNITQRIQGLSLFLLTLIATGCSNINERISFLKANGIEETQKIPEDYNSPAWKPLAGKYVYLIDLFTINNSPKLICLMADKKEDKLVSVYHLNDQVMPATYARGVNPPTIVTNYQEISDDDLKKSDDMNGLNRFFKNIPELKNFSWKNELQNTIVSGIIFKTHFIHVVKDSVDDNLFSYEEKPVKQDHDSLLKNILSANYSLFNRPVKRLNENVEMSQFIKQMGFFYESELPGRNEKETQKSYINDLIKEPIDFKTSGQLCLFYPFKSFIRIQNKGESPFYDPAVAAVEYTFTSDADGFPVFQRKTQFVPLLKK
jgi:hypothetical protein